LREEAFGPEKELSGGGRDSSGLGSKKRWRGSFTRPLGGKERGIILKGNVLKQKKFRKVNSSSIGGKIKEVATEPSHTKKSLILKRVSLDARKGDSEAVRWSEGPSSR